MGSRDPELARIFRDELARAAELLASSGGDARAWRRGLHAMRGTAAMMGASDLVDAVLPLQDGLRRGDPDAAARWPALAAALAAHGVDASAVEAPRFAQPCASTQPPPHEGSLAETRGDWVAYFRAEAMQRLESAGSALDAVAREPERRDRVREGLDASLRDLHAVKGAAAVVGQRDLARGAHAIEGALQALRARATPPTARELEAVGDARARLALALADEHPASAVDALCAALRAAGVLRERDLAPGAPGAGPLLSTRDAGEVIRVPTRTVARLTESVGEAGLSHDRVGRHAEAVLDAARALHGVAAALDDALRRVGPARPWGAPAGALADLAAGHHAVASAVRALESCGRGLQHESEVLAGLTADAGEALRSLGTVTAAWLFDRVAPVAAAAAGGALVRLLRDGDGVELDRGIAERLVEPLSQLVRNAAVHGAEAPERRVAAGKSPRATVRLAASREGDRVRIAVDDDGAGVDLAAVRARAEAAGVLAPGAPDGDVFEALFAPGVTTAARADERAGRGVGLDLVRGEVRRLGGSVRARSRAGQGARFEIELSPRPLVERVVRVRAGEARAEVPLARVRRVERVGPLSGGAVSLAGLFGLPDRARYVVVLAAGAGEVGLAVDDVERPREIVVRPMPAVFGGARGPWCAAAIDGESAVTLVVDPDALAGAAPRGDGGIPLWPRSRGFV